MWQSRPVFISSTFADVQAERDYLRSRVFPELKERFALAGIISNGSLCASASPLPCKTTSICASCTCSRSLPRRGTALPAVADCWATVVARCRARNASKRRP
jgi:hypothetical protein